MTKRVRRSWRQVGLRVLDDPLFLRVLLVAGVIAGLYLALGIARLTRLIDPTLWTLLQGPLSIGIQNTLTFSVSVIALGTGIGFLVGWARVSRHPLLSWPAAAYVDLFRGIPPLVLILFAYFWLPFVLETTDTVSSGLTFAVVALSLHSGAYQAEIFRAGFQSVPRGQIEAAEALGLSNTQTMQHVILPQTFRVTLPALGNEFANVIKDTSLLAAIGAADLVYWGRNIAGVLGARIEWVFAIWMIIALLYFIITYVITQAVTAVEQRFRVPGLGSVAF